MNYIYNSWDSEIPAPCSALSPSRASWLGWTGASKDTYLPLGAPRMGGASKKAKQFAITLDPHKE